MVGILVLINQNIAEPVLIFRQNLWESRQEFVGSQKQVIKIHRTIPVADIYIFLINKTHVLHIRPFIIFNEFGIVEICFNGDEIILII